MAEIVVLNRWRTDRVKRRRFMIGKTEKTDSGKLLLFTGVRYERIGESAPRSLEKNFGRAEQAT